MNGTAFAEEAAAPAKEGKVDLGMSSSPKRKSPVADLPASVTIIEGADLEKLHIKKGIDILRAIPGALPMDTQRCRAHCADH